MKEYIGAPRDGAVGIREAAAVPGSRMALNRKQHLKVWPIQNLHIRSGYERDRKNPQLDLIFCTNSCVAAMFC